MWEFLLFKSKAYHLLLMHDNENTTCIDRDLTCNYSHATVMLKIIISISFNVRFWDMDHSIEEKNTLSEYTVESNHLVECSLIQTIFIVYLFCAYTILCLQAFTYMPILFYFNDVQLHIPNSIYLINYNNYLYISSSLWPHGLQHAKLSCPSPSPGVCLNSCPLSWWCQATITSSFIHFSSCLQWFPTSGSFPVSRIFTSSGQSIGASASASALLMNIQVGFNFELTAFHLLDVQGKLKSLLQHYIQFKSISSSVLSLFYCPTLSSVYDYWKTIGLTRWIFVGK